MQFYLSSFLHAFFCEKEVYHLQFMWRLTSDQWSCLFGSSRQTLQENSWPSSWQAFTSFYFSVLYFFFPAFAIFPVREVCQPPLCKHWPALLHLCCLHPLGCEHLWLSAKFQEIVSSDFKVVYTCIQGPRKKQQGVNLRFHDHQTLERQLPVCV